MFVTIVIISIPVLSISSDFYNSSDLEKNAGTETASWVRVHGWFLCSNDPQPSAPRCALASWE